MMSALLLYSIKSALVLTMLYLPYMLMLRRESFFRFNRLILLGILLLSLALPLCNVPWMSLDHQPVVQAAQLQMLELGIPVHVLPEVQVVADGAVSQQTSRFSVFFLVSLIYIIGMVVLLVARFWQIGRLHFGLHKGVLWKQDEQGVRVYCHAEDVSPFSWMRNIVISKKDFDEAGREIMLHEMGHIQNCHSWDVVLLTLVQMLQWWNPLAYVLGISLRDVHEYEADDYVLRQGVSAQNYQLLLIKKAVGSGSYAFANSFNHSLTKKRITMMKKIKSNPWMRSKALYVIPVAALALSAFATPKFVAPVEEAVTKLEGKDTELSANLQALEEEKEKIEVKEITGEAAASVDEALEKDLDKAPEKTQPLIVLNGQIFEIPKDALKNINKEEQLTKLLNINPEDVESIFVLQKEAAVSKYGDKGSNGVIEINTKKKDDVKELVKKLPGAEMDEDGNIKINGKSVAKIMVDGREAFNIGDSIFNVPAVNAKYPGGEGEMFKFISMNVRYPKLCKEFGVQGRVLVNFVIEKDGSITEINKLKCPGMELSQVDVVSYKEKNPESTEELKEGQDLGELLYEEAVRVLKLMPKWEPAKDKDDNIVRSRFVLPFMFRLN
ncbi:MAG: hypothetical protein IKU02_02670 [Bacteroidaceae bacterium]|nr:hypothetical protein [Bacteroidaceae bacterium]